MHLDKILMPLAIIVGSIALAFALITTAGTLATQGNTAKTRAINECLATAQQIEERGNDGEGWKVTSNKVERETYTFCMSQKGFEVAK